MRHHIAKHTVVAVAWIAAMLAGCASEAPSALTEGFLRSACGPAGGRAIELMIASGEVACSTPPTDLPATRLSVYALGEVDAPEAVDMRTAYHAERCTDGACSAIAGGSLETLRVDGERAELRWSLELADGTLDEGTAWVRLCSGSSACL